MKGQPQIVSLQPDSLAQIWEDFRRVARALGIAEHGEEVIARTAGADGGISPRPRRREQRRAWPASSGWSR